LAARGGGVKTLRSGDSGPDVAALQDAINAHGAQPQLKPDGSFGPATQSALEAFQRANDLYDDGIAGPATWAKIGLSTLDPEVFFDGDRLTIKKLPADIYGGGYNTHKLRADIAEHYLRAYAEIKGSGAILTSSGSMRALTANIGSNRSALSLHYVGRALDLFVYSGMHKPLLDPYVITKDPQRGDHYWRVYARTNAQAGKMITLKAWNHGRFAEELITDRFVDLTAILEANGFKPIRARRSYSRTNYGAAEWWHFQNENGLEPNVTRFGDELLKVYTLKQLEDTPPFKIRDAVWQQDWF
jgi:hypothetical protein